jgi:hypothetical protein
MSETPSARRRKGRIDFDPDTDPMDVNPYLTSKAFGAAEKAEDWLDGWNEAKLEYISSIDEESTPSLEERMDDLERRLEQLERLHP